jgi:hypothetical protein
MRGKESLEPAQAQLSYVAVFDLLVPEDSLVLPLIAVANRHYRKLTNLMKDQTALIELMSD